MTREEALNECVSRDKAIVQLNHLQSDWDDDWNVAIRKCIETIKILPSVTPQPKMGQWEWNQYDANPKIGNFHCSLCHSIGRSYFDYCPYCGAKIEHVPTDSEKEDMLNDD